MESLQAPSIQSCLEAFNILHIMNFSIRYLNTKLQLLLQMHDGAKLNSLYILPSYLHKILNATRDPIQQYSSVSGYHWIPLYIAQQPYG
jgi:hypothetical protein